MKTIGIDARFYKEAGPGRYVKNIISHLEKLDSTNNYLIFLNKKGFDELELTNPNFKKILASYKWYSFEEQIGFLFKLMSCKLDLLYVPHFNIPILYPGKLVTAIPDIIMHTFSTEEGTTLPKFYYKFKKLVYFWVVLIAVFRSEKVIVPSNDTRNDFIKTYPFVSKDKFVLAYEGVDPDLTIVPENSEEILKKYNVKTPYLLYISSMYEHKNVKRLVEAFKILKNKFNYSGSLILIGKKDAFSKKIYDFVSTLGLKDIVLMPGENSYINDSEAMAFRKHADLFVFPSLKEGFSLTPLEAMFAGLGCAVSDIPCHSEILSDSVYYFDPMNTLDIAMKIDELLNNKELKDSLIQRGYETLKKYNWNETAKVTLEVFTKSLKNS